MNFARSCGCRCHSDLLITAKQCRGRWGFVITPAAEAAWYEGASAGLLVGVLVYKELRNQEIKEPPTVCARRRPATAHRCRSRSQSHRSTSGGCAHRRQCVRHVAAQRRRHGDRAAGRGPSSRATTGPTPGIVIRRRHTSSSRTMASKRRCRMPSCSRTTRRTMSSGSTSTAKSGRFSTSSLMRCLSLNFGDAHGR